MSTGLLILALGLLQAGERADGASTRFEPSIVKLERRGNEELWTVRAHDSSVKALLDRVVELSGRTVDGTTAVLRAPLISIDLDRRTLDQMLEFSLGSAGLLSSVDGEVIRVRADRPDEETPLQRAGLASAAWARAAASNPTRPEAAMARLAQGELEELLGRQDSARRRYLDLIAQAPGSGPACEAFLRAGRLAAERGDWSEASEHFRALANLEGADEYRAVARVELARATLQLGDAKGALHILDALDSSHPCWEPTERTARILVRIEALLEESRFQDALLEIEGAHDLDPLGAREFPRFRARALEGTGLLDEAAHAWLLVAREEQGPARIAAFQTSARLAEESGDLPAVLFVAREAAAAGLAASVAQAEQRARAGLGLVEPDANPTPSASARLERAERLLVKHDLETASAELKTLYEAREGLDLAAPERARLVVAWARCTAAYHGVEAAMSVAHAERELIEPGEARATLDRGVASLLEQYGLYARAADAYQGEY